MFVVVYGTLKRGYGNNGYLRGAKFLSEVTVGGFKLYDAGFPVAVPAEGHEVLGELWDIGDDPHILAGLDGLEGFHDEGDPYNMYDRKVVGPIVALNDDDQGHIQEILDTTNVSMYVGNPKTWQFERMNDTKYIVEGTDPITHSWRR